jgi:tRNA-Thr(GGU) m(6)t(6)A37 methyltransferase TsaA
MEFVCRPIGVIHSPFRDRKGMPIQAAFSEAQGTVEIDPEYADGLEGIEGFSHIILLYLFHQSDGYQLRVKPFLDDVEWGLFATRYPARPNPIGISVVKLLARDGNRLLVGGIDVLDGTPLLDVKPFVPRFDHREGARVGWLEGKT